MDLRLTIEEFERTGKVADLIFHGIDSILYGASNLVGQYLFAHYRGWRYADPKASFLVHDDDDWYLVRILEMTSFNEGEDVYFESMTVEIDTTYPPNTFDVLDLEPRIRRPLHAYMPNDEDSDAP